MPQPDPQLSPVTLYWEFVAADDFSLPLCLDCNNCFLPPRMFCPKCGSKSIGWKKSDGSGEVYSYSVVERPPKPEMAEQVPYVIALATLQDLSEGSRFYARLVDVTPDQVHVGQRVVVDIRKLGSSNPLPVLIPAEVSE